jgi:hypothetical protein
MQVSAIYFPPSAHLPDTIPPNKTDFAVIAISIILPMNVVEMTKTFVRRK